MADHTQSVVRPKPYQLLGTPRNSSELLPTPHISSHLLPTPHISSQTPPKLLPTPPNSSQTHWITPPNSLDIQACYAK